MRIQTIIVVLSIGLFIAACGEKKETINVSGSTTVLPVVSNGAEQFKANHPTINIIVNAGGSGVGINQLGEGKIDIGMASRDITDEEISKYPDVKFNVISVGKDAVVPVVSSEIYNAGVQALTLDQIAKIYKGEISNWNQVGGPDKEILCVDKEQSRGTRHVFMEVVMGDKKAEAAGADLVLGSNNEEQTAIVQSDAAIGMLSNAWLNDDIVGLKIILEDSSVVAPTLQNIINGKFPITRDLYLITNGEPMGNIKSFVEYILSAEGQEIVEKAGYVSINQ